MRSIVLPRHARKIVALCLLIVSVALFALASRADAGVAPRTARKASELVTNADAHARGKIPFDPIAIDGVLAYAPPTRTRDRVVVYLHGIHGRAENGCPHLRAGASSVGWLVCPEANVVEAPGFTWGGSVSDKRAIVSRAEQAAYARGADPSKPGVIVGFSQGSYVALELVRARLGRYEGLVLLGADVEPDARELARAGVRRVVLGSGDRDAPRAALERTAARLRKEGVEARFTSLGAVGHTYVAEDPAALADAIAWAGGA